MIFKLPNRKIPYKTGVLMVNREDDLAFQCTVCYKPFFEDEVIISAFLAQIECPNCQCSLRKITESEPLI